MRPHRARARSLDPWLTRTRTYQRVRNQARTQHVRATGGHERRAHPRARTTDRFTAHTQKARAQGHAGEVIPGSGNGVGVRG
jgi:hypothetical protein